MKKFIILFLTLTIIFSTSSCTSNENYQQGTNTTQPFTDNTNKPTTSKPVTQTPIPTTEKNQEIVLTPQNISSYLIFDTSVSDISVHEYRLDTYSIYRHEGYLQLNVYPKVPGTFKNVSVTIRFNSASEVWKIELDSMAAERTLSFQIPFDGKTSKTKKVVGVGQDDYDYHPEFYTEFISVSGTYVK